jgi:2-polyprenyl-3-methyl-5-hydroxy-6-metoxy-1,4-benzoquinol methylase
MICALCGAASETRLGVNPSFGMPMFRCSACGTLQTEQPSADVLERFNAGFRESWSEDRVKAFAAMSTRRAKSQINFVSTHAAGLLTGGGGAMDLGAGVGTMATTLRRWFDPVWAIESDTRSRAIMEEAGGLKVTGSLDDVPPGQLSLIVMSHVLEHVARPVDLLSALVQRLRP